jgi:hypothetical protein
MKWFVLDVTLEVAYGLLVLELRSLRSLLS